jgi:hypothetical protein
MAEYPSDIPNSQTDLSDNLTGFRKFSERMIFDMGRLLPVANALVHQISQRGAYFEVMRDAIDLFLAHYASLNEAGFSIVILHRSISRSEFEELLDFLSQSSIRAQRIIEPTKLVEFPSWEGRRLESCGVAILELRYDALCISARRIEGNDKALVTSCARSLAESIKGIHSR